MSNTAKESEDCNERTWIQNKQPGEMFLSGYKASTDGESKWMADQYVRETDDKEHLLSEEPAQIKPSFRLPHTWAGTTALLSFVTSDHQDEGSQHQLLVLPFLRSAPLSGMLTSYLITAQL